MEQVLAIKVQSLSKVYHLYDKPQDRLKEALHPLRKSFHQDYWALNNVSIDIKKGETVGIVGKNGSGKSTLLKIVTGVLTPSEGLVEVNGKVASLLELGAGFNPEMTGVENIYLNGIIMGFSKEEMDYRIAEIVEFADIGDFIHQQVKTYSSGMFARLAFSVAINVDPDILIIDEALSVGDMQFSQKAIRKMKEFQENNKTILFVSHDMRAIASFCTKTVWIDKGVIREAGDSEAVIKNYSVYMEYGEVVGGNDSAAVTSDLEESINLNDWVSLHNYESFGQGKAKIKEIALLSVLDRKSIAVFCGGEIIELLLKIQVIESIEKPIVGFLVRDRLGNDIASVNSFVIQNKNELNGLVIGSNLVSFQFEMPYLANGSYSISPAIADGTQDCHVQHHWVQDALEIKYLSTEPDAELGCLIKLRNVKIKVTG